MLRLLTVCTLLVAAPARAQTTVVVTAAPEGLRFDAPADDPVGDAPAALLTYVPDGQWHLQVLSRGDVPTREAASGLRAPAPPRPPALPVRPTFGRGAYTSSAELVTYHVRGRVAADKLDAALVRLSESDALRSLDAASRVDGTTVEAVFAFDSTADWAAWQVRPETQALLAPLADSETALRVHR